MRASWAFGFLLLAGTGCDGGGDSADTGVDLSPCEADSDPEVFLGRGVGGAFVPIEDGQELGLSVAPQGGFGVSVLVGTRRFEASPESVVTAVLEGASDAVPQAAASFTQSASLQCKTDGPDGAQGVIYGVVVGFSSSLSNDQLLTMNGQDAALTVTLTDEAERSASVTQHVTLVVGE